MKTETKPNEFIVFNADVKKMSDAELEASLRELRCLTVQDEQPIQLGTFFRARAA
jgi:hypothetical protein